LPGKYWNASSCQRKQTEPRQLLVLYSAPIHWRQRTFTALFKIVIFLPSYCYESSVSFVGVFPIYNSRITYTKLHIERCRDNSKGYLQFWTGIAQDRQCKYKRNMGRLLATILTMVKVISTKYSECLCLALVIRHEKTHAPCCYLWPDCFTISVPH